MILKNSSLLDEKKDYANIKKHPDLLLHILDSLPFHLLVFQENGKIEFINKDMKECLAIKMGNVIGKNIFDILPNEQVKLWKSRTKSVLNKDTTISFNCKKNDNEFKINFFPIENNDFSEKRIIAFVETNYGDEQQKKAEEKIKRSKEHLEKLIHNTSEIIFSIDNNYKITLWNKTAENISGIKINRIIGTDIRNNNFVENKLEFNHFLDKKFNHKNLPLNYIKLKTLFGSLQELKLSSSIVTNEKNQVTDIIFICKDVTLKNETKGQLVQGLSYLIEDNEPDRLVQLFNELISEKNKGLFITRSQFEKTISLMNIDHVTLAVLSDRTIEFAPTINDLTKLKSMISSFIKKNKHSIICIDRVDYLFTTFGFKPCMSIFYDINDVIRKNQALLLVRVNTRMFSNYEYEILKEEFTELPSNQTEDIHLDEQLLSILAYVNQQNSSNQLVYQKNISKLFDISRVTVQKRLYELKQQGLIFYERQGRIKRIFITNKGKSLILN